jgi:hypothetical protein
MGFFGTETKSPPSSLMQGLISASILRSSPLLGLFGERDGISKPWSRPVLLGPAYDGQPFNQSNYSWLSTPDRGLLEAIDSSQGAVRTQLVAALSRLGLDGTEYGYHERNRMNSMLDGYRKNFVSGGIPPNTY